VIAETRFRRPRWEVRAACHLPDRNQFLLHAVRPLLDRVAGTVDCAYFVPHWRRGPHVRVVVETTQDRFERVVLPSATEVLGGYLAEHRPPVPLDPGAHLAEHRRLAEVESDPGELLPWYEHGDVLARPHDDRIELLGSAHTADLLVDFYARTTASAFAALERPGTGSAVGFDLLVATAHTFARDGITNGFIAFRSHAEAFRWGTPEGRHLRPVWDRHRTEHGPALAERVRALVTALDAGVGIPSPVASWLAALRPIAARATALAPLGLLPATRQGSDDPVAALRDVSPFHRELASRSWWQATLPTSTWFRVYRVLVNFAYLHLTRIGAMPAQRFLLCHSVANAVEDAYGVSAAELVAR